MNRKLLVSKFANFFGYLILPLYILKEHEFINKLMLIFRSAVIKRYIEWGGGAVGKKFHIGRNCIIKKHRKGNFIVGDNVAIGDNVMINIGCDAVLTIGSEVHIGYGGRVSCFERINIGNNTLIASYANILDHNHKFDLKRVPSTTLYDCMPIDIAEGVWLGTKVQVNKGVSVESFSVVGANAVVTKSLKRGVYGGIPARKIK